MGMETDIQWAGWFYIEQVLLIIYVLAGSALQASWAFLPILLQP